MIVYQGVCKLTGMYFTNHGFAVLQSLPWGLSYCTGPKYVIQYVTPDQENGVLAENEICGCCQLEVQKCCPEIFQALGTEIDDVRVSSSSLLQ